MQRDPAAWLEDIRESGEAIQTDTAGLSFDEYLADRRTRQATERNFQIIGQAIVNLREHFPDIFARIDSAREVIEFRNVLVHGYFSLDESRVWRVIEDELPDLLRQINELLEEYGD